MGGMSRESNFYNGSIDFHSQTVFSRGDSKKYTRRTVGRYKRQESNPHRAQGRGRRSASVFGEKIETHENRFHSVYSTRTPKVLFSRPKGSDERSDLGGASRRQWAQLLDETGHVQEARVIVEFKERPPIREFSFDPKSVDHVKKELRSLVKELRLAERFQVLYCHGFYEAPEHYGLVYRLPTAIIPDDYMQCESLGNVLMHEEYTSFLAENLQNRLDLAKSLATTMYHLHSVQWVHKSFNPDNILLFGRRSWDKKVEFNWAQPYVVGFDASRANRAHSDKLPASLRWDNRVYTHPARQREGEWTRFHKLFDIYSLGVVLLEIGTLTCFKNPSFRRNAEWTDIPAGEVQKRLGMQAVALKGELGRTYSEIVQVCLSGEFGVPNDEDDADETMLLDAFRSEVCEKFEQVCY